MSLPLLLLINPQRSTLGGGSSSPFVTLALSSSLVEYDSKLLRRADEVNELSRKNELDINKNYYYSAFN